MKLVVGLGNVGTEFELTRHNVGFMAVDALAEAKEATWKHQTKFFAHTAQVEIDGHRVLLAKPDTLMNRSGKAVQALAHYHKCELSDIVVISDDLDLVFGKVRVRIGGSSGGQNGLKSIIEALGEGFVRVRIGVASTERGRIDARDYVLQRFSAYEQKHLASITTQTSQLVEQIVTEGPEHVSHSILDTAQPK